MKTLMENVMTTMEAIEAIVEDAAPTRKLASIQVISDITPHPNADAIEIAHVLGWKTIVKKGDFKPGDLCVYFEVDSVLPIKEEYSFLKGNSYVRNDWIGEGYRLRTIKLRQHISQGLALSVDILWDVPNHLSFWDNHMDEWVFCGEVGTDVTHVLGVRKWEPPVPAQLAGKIRGNFPSFIRKTDQERVQNCWQDVVNRGYDLYEVTTKLDGSSMTAYIHNGRFGICSRNLDLIETEGNAFWTIARLQNIEEKMREAFRLAVQIDGEPVTMNMAIQGELVGPGVQGNHDKLKDLDFYVFDIWDIENHRYLAPFARREYCRIMGLNHVPVLEENFELPFTSVDESVAYATGPSINAEYREGVVFKSVTNPNFSFKAISNEYLLKHGD